MAHARGKDECWLWPGADSGNGYGRISVDGKTRATHIVAYELFTGTRVPPGMVLDHRCRNRRCFNPWHLKPISGVVNTMIGEGPTAHNALKTHCIRGHELAGDNLISRTRKGRKPSRECRTCRKARLRPLRLSLADAEQQAGGRAGKARQQRCQGLLHMHQICGILLADGKTKLFEGRCERCKCEVWLTRAQVRTRARNGTITCNAPLVATP